MQNITQVEQEYTLTIKGFKTEAQVKTFAEWYSEQGEQNSGDWFECRKEEGEIDVDFMSVDCTKMIGKWDIFVNNNMDLYLNI